VTYDPRERAAETKRRRTRERLIQAADEVIKEQGIQAGAEAIAQAAGLSTATFYNVFASRETMFRSVWEELVAEPHRQAVAQILKRAPMNAILDWPSERARLTDLLSSLEPLVKGRQHLVRGVLVGRLTDPPSTASTYNWLEVSETGDDPVHDLGRRIMSVVPYEMWILTNREFDTRRFAAVLLALKQTALLVLDQAAQDRFPLVESVADTLLGIFEVQITIFDRPESERRGLNRYEREALAKHREFMDELLSRDE
jgi:AcrR family transcriptional regulator